jgi:hypothetical protein
MQSIGSEKERWISQCLKLSKDKKTLLGDVIIACGFVTYLSMFEGNYRQKIYQQKWCRIVENFGIEYSSQQSVRTLLSTEE